MNNKERAKQFIPFDAMKGLTEALKVREERRSRIERKQLSKDMAARISSALSRIEAGTSVRIVFFCDGHYIDIEGSVSEKDTVCD